MKSPRPIKDGFKLLNFIFLILVNNTTKIMLSQTVLTQKYLLFSGLIVSFPICDVVNDFST